MSEHFSSCFGEIFVCEFTSFRFGAAKKVTHYARITARVKLTFAITNIVGSYTSVRQCFLAAVTRTVETFSEGMNLKLILLKNSHNKESQQIFEDGLLQNTGFLSRRTKFRVPHLRYGAREARVRSVRLIFSTLFRGPGTGNSALQF